MAYGFVLLLLVLLYVLYECVRVWRLIGRVPSAERYERSFGSQSMLVLGDSTAVGVGALTPGGSVAGYLAAALDASVENYAKSGAVAADIHAQFARAQRGQYDLVLVQIGANDVIRFRSHQGAQENLDRLLQAVAHTSDHVVLITAGKIGDAPFFPRLLAPILTMRAQALRKRFIETATLHGAVYVDLYHAADPFSSDPARYYAPDGLHLTSDGYRFWFDETRQAIQKRWPHLLKHAE